MIRLTLTPAETPGKFIARLDGEFVCQSHQPIVDGARELLKRGFDPSLAMTARHDGKAFDSFAAHSVGAWAEITYSEGERGIRPGRWRPNPVFGP